MSCHVCGLAIGNTGEKAHFTSSNMFFLSMVVNDESKTIVLGI
jgi:hypothetical protein